MSPLISDTTCLRSLLTWHGVCSKRSVAGEWHLPITLRPFHSSDRWVGLNVSHYSRCVPNWYTPRYIFTFILLYWQCIHLEIRFRKNTWSIKCDVKTVPVSMKASPSGARNQILYIRNVHILFAQPFRFPSQLLMRWPSRTNRKYLNVEEKKIQIRNFYSRHSLGVTSTLRVWQGTGLRVSLSVSLNHSFSGRSSHPWRHLLFVDVEIEAEWDLDWHAVGHDYTC